MNNKIVCDTKRVQDYLRLRDQYQNRIDVVKAKIQAAKAELRVSVVGLERIQVSFIDDATKYKGQSHEGVFPDGEGGFVHVTAQRSTKIHGSKNILIVEKVTQ